MIGKGNHYTPDQKEALLHKIITFLEGGLSRHDACALVEVADTTLSAWIHENEEIDARIKKAERILKEKMLFYVRKAAEKTWQAACWMLERKFPDEFALRTKTEFSGYVEGSETDVEKRQRLIKLRGYLNKIDLGEKRPEKVAA